MPDLCPEIQDLISRMLCVDVHSRITISQIKSHPAFLMFLPAGYQVPRPLPTPAILTPVELTPSEVQFLRLLQSIGYNSDEEIIQELTSNTHTNAKTFYQMYNRAALLDSLPWYDENEPSALNVSHADDALMMPPWQFAVGVGAYGSLSNGIESVKTPQSFAQRVGWYSSAAPTFSTDIEQMLIDIQLPLEELMLFLQRQLSACGIKWFHQSDIGMVAKRVETDMLLTITASYESSEMLALCLLLVHGEKDEFEDLIRILQNGLLELLNCSHN